MNRKRLILCILLGVLAVCMTYAFYAMPRLEKAPPPSDGEQAVRQQPQRQGGGLQRVQLARLQEAAEPFPGAERDIFRFKVKRVVPPPSPPVRAPERVVTPPPQPIAPPVPIEETQRALANFTFLGFLEKAGQRTVFLSSAGDLFVVKPGERFGKNQEFVVTGIEEKTLNIQRRGDSQTIRIPLVENETLKPVISSPAPASGTGVHFAVPRSMNMPFRRGLQRRSQEPPPVPQEEAIPGETENLEETGPGDMIEEQPPTPGEGLQGEADGTNQ